VTRPSASGPPAIKIYNLDLYKQTFGKSDKCQTLEMATYTQWQQCNEQSSTSSLASNNAGPHRHSTVNAYALHFFAHSVSNILQQLLSYLATLRTSWSLDVILHIYEHLSNTMT
jgi:hypothetical protein